MDNFIVSYLVVTYIIIGLIGAISTVSVLVKDGKDSPIRIAYYATVNGLGWPYVLGAAIVKIKKEMKERGEL